MGFLLERNVRLISSLNPIHADGENTIHNVVLMIYDKNVKENNYYAHIAEFLRRINVTVPEIVYHDQDKGYIVMEDLGNIDLWAFRDASWETRRDYYFKTLAMANTLHSFPIDEFPADQIPLMDGFGPNLYQWEQNYFLENFIGNYCHIELDISKMAALNEELSGLADILERKDKCLVHRDFQSQNVMIYNDKPVLIDFQGMRIGSPFYDLGSLLYDPYVVLRESERLELLRYYYNLSIRKQEWSDFQEMFNLASAQRLMQALGAYGYLGLKVHKTEFLQHIPNGLNNLLDATMGSESLPQLENLCRRCITIINSHKSNRIN